MKYYRVSSTHHTLEALRDTLFEDFKLEINEQELSLSDERMKLWLEALQTVNTLQEKLDMLS